MKRLKSLLRKDMVIDLKSEEKYAALEELVDVISKSDMVTDKRVFLKEIIKREKIMSTGIGLGIAVPHVKISSVKDFVIAIGRSKKGIDFNAIDEKLVHIFVMIGASDTQAKEYIKLLAQLVLRLKRRDLRERIMKAEKPEEIIDIFLSTIDSGED
jgi:fructose-specific phosphotransferase system IIA component